MVEQSSKYVISWYDKLMVVRIAVIVIMMSSSVMMIGMLHVLDHPIKNMEVLAQTPGTRFI
jgi:hypothetical protein